MTNAALFTSNSPEWNTPPQIVDLVVAVLGSIDLDPCADTLKRIPAHTHYTAADNGLLQAWRGKAYVNPPYGRQIGQWTAKLLREYRIGNVTEAIALVPARTDTAWFNAFAQFPRCFVRGRLRFSGSLNSAPFPSAIIYMGNHADHFADHFSKIGNIYTLWGKTL